MEHTEHSAARDTLARLLSAGDQIAIAPQVLAEFIHIVTDYRRFTQPLDMIAARQMAEGRDSIAQAAGYWCRKFIAGEKRRSGYHPRPPGM
jgi:predicted nucleic acid-binding protein